MEDGKEFVLEEGEEAVLSSGDVVKFRLNKFHYKVEINREDDTESEEESEAIQPTRGGNKLQQTESSFK